MDANEELRRRDAETAAWFRERQRAEARLLAAEVGFCLAMSAALAAVVVYALTR